MPISRLTYLYVAKRSFLCQAVSAEKYGKSTIITDGNLLRGNNFVVPALHPGGALEKIRSAQAVILHLALELDARKSQRFRRMRYVAAIARERFRDEARFPS